MPSIQEVANQLKKVDEYVKCIFAFNATGKTRLSVAYKYISKDANGGNNTGVYYNSYSEDLFDWDNDEPNDNYNIKLVIKQSKLNTLHSLIKEENIEEELISFNPTYKFRFNSFEDAQNGIESVTFFKENETGVSIKISSGETRIFIWCFFLALFKIDTWTGQLNEYLFIDDPVSSLDDNNVHIVADTIMRLVEDNFNSNRHIILTTHHVGLLSVLFDRLKKGEKSGRYGPNSAFFILKRNGDELELNNLNKEVFLYHLHLFQVLHEARSSKLFTYHFVLLRQLLENIVSFLGKSQLKFVLEEISVDKPEETTLMLNSLSHKKVYVPQISEMNDTEISVFNEIFDKLLVKYNFKF